MTLNGWLQIALYCVLIIAFVKPFGAYMAHVFAGERTWFSLVLRPVERALYGLKLSHIPTPPPAISPKLEYQYFAIDKSGPCWEHIRQTGHVGLYIPGDIPAPEPELVIVLKPE